MALRPVNYIIANRRSIANRIDRRKSGCLNQLLKRRRARAKSPALG
jgi:hypothetical protein